MGLHRRKRRRRKPPHPPSRRLLLQRRTRVSPRRRRRRRRRPPSKLFSNHLHPISYFFYPQNGDQLSATPHVGARGEQLMVSCSRWRQLCGGHKPCKPPIITFLFLAGSDVWPRFNTVI